MWLLFYLHWLPPSLPQTQGGSCYQILYVSCTSNKLITVCSVLQLIIVIIVTDYCVCVCVCATGKTCNWGNCKMLYPMCPMLRLELVLFLGQFTFVPNKVNRKHLGCSLIKRWLFRQISHIRAIIGPIEHLFYLYYQTTLLRSKDTVLSNLYFSFKLCWFIAYYVRFFIMIFQEIT